MMMVLFRQTLDEWMGPKSAPFPLCPLLTSLFDFKANPEEKRKENKYLFFSRLFRLMKL